ncbi:MAG: HAD family hydrolase [bacterium]|nr:HAD family hydrolase [bacterium]
MKNKIKVIIWDVDGTLYKNDPLVGPVFEQTRQELLEKYWQRSYKEELKSIFEAYKEKYKSATKALSVLTGLSLREVNQYVESRLKDSRSLQKDKKLIKMFRQMPNIHHLALRNGGKKETLHILDLLGLGQVKLPYPAEFGPFIKVWGTVDDFNEVKPNLVVFDQVKLWVFKNLFWDGKSRLSLSAINGISDQVLMVGDRDEVDLSGAKEVGFKTALVWSQTKEKKDYIDWLVDDVYGVKNLVV